MSRRVALTVVATALTSVLFAAVATSGGVHLWVEPQFDAPPPDLAPADVDPPPVETEFAPSDGVDQTPTELPGWIDAILRGVAALLVVIAIAAAIVGVIALVMAAWRNRPRLRWRRRWAGDSEFEVLPDVAAAVVDEAPAHRATLLGGTPRNAIVRCWALLERDVASVGLTPDPADTSAEFTERVLARYAVDPEAIRQLAALYREARFSRHPLDESARRSASDALDRLHQALGEVADAAAAGDPANSAIRVSG